MEQTMEDLMKEVKKDGTLKNVMKHIVIIPTLLFIIVYVKKKQELNKWIG